MHGADGGKILQQGVMKPSQSPWTSPIVLVVKKNGSTWFLHRLQETQRHHLDECVYSLPRIDDTLDLLANIQYFTTLDLASGEDG